MNYQTSVQSLSTMEQSLDELLEAGRLSVPSTMIVTLVRGSTLVRISLTASHVGSVGTVYKSLLAEKE